MRKLGNKLTQGSYIILQAKSDSILVLYFIFTFLQTQTALKGDKQISADYTYTDFSYLKLRAWTILYICLSAEQNYMYFPYFFQVWETSLQISKIS